VRRVHARTHVTQAGSDGKRAGKVEVPKLQELGQVRSVLDWVDLVGNSIEAMRRKRTSGAN
jgi:hypothetical protein